LMGGIVLRLKHTAQEKFVANQWTFEENKRPSIPYKGSFSWLINGAGDGNRTRDLLFTKQLLCH
jgi:hypothetical protein